MNDFDAFAVLIHDKMSSPLAVYDERFPTDDAGIGYVLRVFEESDEFFALTEQHSGKLVGFASLNRLEEGVRNLGLCLHSAYRGQGMGTEAAQALAVYAKGTLKLKKLVSGTGAANLSVIRLLDSIGFTRSGSESASFSCNESGKPLVFTAYSYELKL